MNKDVIYIDVEDDITTIVGKIKDSKEKIIALVPPNRVGVLQSAVNMRLLQRTADTVKKRVVLITNNQSLIGLAASAKIPVARTLQSKPELVPVPVIKVDDDDVIDGETLPVGEFARSAEQHPSNDAVDAVIGTAAVSAAQNDTDRTRLKKIAGGAAVAKAAGNRVKVPDFTKFRKKLFLIIGAALLLIGFLVWAIWFAPRATVIISAKTNPVTVDKTVTLTTDGATDTNLSLVKAMRQEQNSDISVEFTPTGKKDVGEKAKGKVRFKTSGETILLTGLTVPAGTEVASSSGIKYKTTEAATFTKGDASGLDGRVVGIEAVDSGEKYNGASGSATTSARGVTSAAFVGATSGGTTKMVTVVSASDVSRAADMLNEKKDDQLKQKLTESFSSSSVIISESYQESRSEPTPSVAVDAEANGAVTLKATITGTMFAVDNVDLSGFLKDSINQEIEGKKNQKIYEDGSKDIKFTQFSNKDDKTTVRMTANGSVGPSIDESKVKEQSRKKTYGEIQSSIEVIEGVNDVDIKFWPSWVRTVPDNTNRIVVEFKLQDAN